MTYCFLVKLPSLKPHVRAKQGARAFEARRELGSCFPEFGSEFRVPESAAPGASLCVLVLMVYTVHIQISDDRFLATYP